jgi:hypothetical protein
MIRELDAFDLKWTVFMKPFSLTLWITVLLAIMLCSVCLTATYRVQRLYGMEEAEDFSVVTDSFRIAAVFCVQGNLLHRSLISAL